jgi:hypothetical protein
MEHPSRGIYPYLRPNDPQEVLYWDLPLLALLDPFYSFFTFFSKQDSHLYKHSWRVGSNVWPGITHYSLYMRAGPRVYVHHVHNTHIINITLHAKTWEERAVLVGPAGSNINNNNNMVLWIMDNALGLVHLSWMVLLWMVLSDIDGTLS